MRYAKIVDQIVVQYPITGTDIVLQNPNTSFPYGELSQELMAEYSCLPVAEVPAPNYDQRTQFLSEGKCVFNAGSNRWEASWVVKNKTQSEMDAETTNKANKVRVERNQRLSECDWTQVSDAPVDKTAWATYRQALRDVTSQSGFPWTITWPDAP